MQPKPNGEKEGDSHVYIIHYQICVLHLPLVVLRAKKFEILVVVFVHKIKEKRVWGNKVTLAEKQNHT